MDFELSDERRMLAETAERYLADQYPMARRHKAAAEPSGFDADAWAEMAELGLVAALLPPEAGGLGGMGEDLLVVFERLGRAAVVEPFLAQLLGATALQAVDADTDWEAVAEGRLRLAFAHTEPGTRFESAHVATRAVPTETGWRLTGRKTVVLNGDSADRILVSARIGGDDTDADGIGLFLVDGTNLERRGYGTVEGGQAADLTLADTAAQALGAPGEALPAIEATLARGALAVSAEALGLMEVCKDTTLDYLKTRSQFGRPIGAFQALQHRMVDMLLEIEQARSAVMLAAGLADSPSPEATRALHAAKHLVGRTGRLVAEEAIQLHGGIAMTWEYDLPHYAKRLVMIDHLFGDTDHHLERFIAMAGAEGVT
ncbi:MAG: acyl-CoA dehydrogenase [Pseudomonadota bacterium]